MTEQTIIFFDGVCGLCNRTVDFVLREDRDRNFLFSALQGETFQRIARDCPETMNVDSIFVYRPGPQGGSCSKEVTLSFVFWMVCRDSVGWRGSGTFVRRLF